MAVILFKTTKFNIFQHKWIYAIGMNDIGSSRFEPPNRMNPQQSIPHNNVKTYPTKIFLPQFSFTKKVNDRVKSGSPVILGVH